METRDIIKKLREKNGLTQEQMAERLMISRQAVSRWENGETQPDTESLKLLSKEFNVSINTLLGTPRQLICQCCGMPLNEDSLISREKDGSYNEDYCPVSTPMVSPVYPACRSRISSSFVLFKESVMRAKHPMDLAEGKYL